MTTLKLLLVEDNAVNQAYLTAVIESVSKSEEKLEQGRFSVTISETLEESFVVLENQKIDIILLDLTLPDSHGLATFENIHEKKPNIPIIILTGVDDTELALKAVKLGAQDYLIKGKINKLLLYRSIQYAIQRTSILAALIESEERYSLALQATNDGIWEWNLRSNTIYYSSRWGEILGLDSQEINGTSEEWFDRIHPEDVSRVEDEIHQHLSNETPKLYSEHRLLHKNGSYIWVRVQGKAMLDQEGSVKKIAGSLIDITAERLQDSLTGLPNKALFFDRIQSVVSRLQHNGGTNFVVMILELENYKLISSNFGPQAAEYALLSAVDKISRTIRETDSLARTGASEFGIILYDNPEVVEVDKIAKEIHKLISKPLLKDGTEFSMTVSIGMVFVDKAFESATEIYRDGVTALQKALQKGRGSTEIYDSEMRTKILNILQMEGRLLRAVERHEFLLQYQPIVSLQEKKVSSFEALIRWDSGGKRINPNEFIPIAEETDMIIRMGAWVIEEATIQLQRWSYKDNIDTSVAINFSLRQFKDSDIINYLKKSLSIAKLAHEKIIVEVTESIAMNNISYSLQMLNVLNESGFTISIDDFGTGYSSLSYLKTFPINKIKIDKSFIDEVPHNPDSTAIVRAMIQMAHALSYEVVVEGIENEEQYNFCKEQGADYGQGYYISRPLDPENVSNFIKTYMDSN